MTPNSARPDARAGDRLGDQLGTAVEAISAWMAEFGAYESHPAMDMDAPTFGDAFEELCNRLRDNYPFSTRGTSARCSNRRTRRPSSATSRRC
jgi:hypothetical protein